MSALVSDQLGLHLLGAIGWDLFALVACLFVLRFIWAARNAL
jgi:hypothetical protein